MRLQRRSLALAITLMGTLLSVAPARSASLTPELQKALDSSKYVYVQSARKDGTLSKPAEIWFMPYNGAVWVASPVTTYRVKRIQAGQTKAKKYSSEWSSYEKKFRDDLANGSRLLIKYEPAE